MGSALSCPGVCPVQLQSNCQGWSNLVFTCEVLNPIRSSPASDTLFSAVKTVNQTNILSSSIWLISSKCSYLFCHITWMWTIVCATRCDCIKTNLPPTCRSSLNGWCRERLILRFILTFLLQFNDPLYHTIVYQNCPLNPSFFIIYIYAQCIFVQRL